MALPNRKVGSYVNVFRQEEWHYGKLLRIHKHISHPLEIELYNTKEVVHCRRTDVNLPHEIVTPNITKTPVTQT